VNAPNTSTLSPDTLIELYRRMLQIRVFEEQAIELFAKGLITGTTHPCIGQEAISVGVCAALRKEDQVLATYRGHGAALAKGCSPATIMAELLTRTTGCCKGRGGSMHLCDVRQGFLGTNAIVAAHIPIAGGVALSNKLRKQPLVTACFFGDGASCEGEFFETLNMAALWKVPLIFVCENNGYAISVPTSMSQATPDIADRARGFGVSSMVVDGNDIVSIYQAALVAVDQARNGRGPVFIECKTVRWERHSAFSAGRYENSEEAQKWKSVDPVPRFTENLLASGISALQLAEVAKDCQAEIAAAVSFAMQSPQPDAESVFEGIFAE
jgi:acetoin:2,6-dichlorophenolindophenol oxidoreductase subunit alpha